MNKRSGGMLIPVTLAMVAIGIMGAAMVSVVRTSSQRGVQHSYDERAYYVARGGVAYARTNPRGTFAGAVFSLGDGDEFVLSMTNDSLVAFANVVGRAGAGSPWEAHYTHEEVQITLGTEEGYAPVDMEDFKDSGSPHVREEGSDSEAGWDAGDELAKDDSERFFSTELEIVTEQGWRSSDYLTFQNFTEVITDQGFVAKLVPSGQIDPAARAKDFYGIWGNASDNIYVVGEDGIIVHYDGTTQGGLQWHQMTSPTAQLLRAVWGVPRVSQAGVPERMIAVGDGGEILEYSGGAWQRLVNPRHNYLPGFALGQPYTPFDIHGVYGTDWDNITTYGDYGGSPYKWLGRKPWYRYMGGVIPPPNDDRLWEYRGDNDPNSIWRPYDIYDWRYRMFRGNWETAATGPRYIFSVGHDRRANWNRAFIFNEIGTPEYYVGINGMHTANAVWGVSVNNAYVVGRTATGNGRMLRSTQALRSDRWNWQTIPAVPSLNGIYGGSADYIFAGGDDGTLLFYDGSAWSEVKGQDGNNITPNDINSVWGTAQTGLYGVGDNGTIVYLGYPANPIGGYIMPMNNNAQFTAHWATNNHFLSYSIQSKLVWGDDLEYAATGFNFRWRLAAGTTNRYEGYGVSFMRYAPGASGINDQVPNSIKPAFQSASEKSDRLLVVVWDQTVTGGNEQRRWLAYKDLTADARVARGDGHLRDLSTLMVRVEDAYEHHNRVTVYYGNASASAQPGDAVHDNTRRLAYNPESGTPTGTTTWPPFDVQDWTATGDFFTVVANVSVAENPTAGDYWILNPAVPASSVSRPSHPAIQGHELFLSAFQSPQTESFGSQAERPEVGIHVFGDIGDHGTQALVSFAEFRLRLGVNR